MGRLGDAFIGWLDKRTAYLDDLNPDAAIGGSWSYDWCRFRRHRSCWYAEAMHVPATELVGYPVWIPLERGICWRDKWESQQLCPMAESGPNTGQRDAEPDATIPWELGGQRGGWVNPNEPVDHRAMIAEHPEILPMYCPHPRPFHPSAAEPGAGSGKSGLEPVADLATGFALGRMTKRARERRRGREAGRRDGSS